MVCKALMSRKVMIGGKICVEGTNKCRESVIVFHDRNGCVHIDIPVSLSEFLGIDSYRYGLSLEGTCRISSSEIVFTSVTTSGIELEAFLRKDIGLSSYGDCKLVLKKERGFSIVFGKEVCRLLSRVIKDI